MAFSLAIGLLLLIGGLVVASLISFVLFIPAFALMLLAERSAASRQTD